MSCEPGSLDRLLADALGEDNAVTAELRALFLASATRHVAVMSAAPDEARWRDEALRMQGLAASFGITPLMEMAAEAARCAPDAVRLDQLAQAIAACR